MARRRHATPTVAFDAITVEGSLIAPAVLSRIAAQADDSKSANEYGILKGLSLRDEIARYFRVGQAHFASFSASRTPSHNATIAFVEALCRDVLGFTDVQRVGTRTQVGRTFAVTLECSAGRVPVIVVPPPGDDPSADDRQPSGLDAATDHLPGDGRRKSAATALQDWLNASDGALWGLCSNGTTIRLLRDNASLTRPAYIEADLRRIFADEAFADFAALWLLCHRSRFGEAGKPPSDCALERWRDAGAKEGIAARGRLGEGFEAALLALGRGFVSHADNRGLRDRLQSGALPLPDYFGELLRLVYRLIFLLVAEDRGLLHPPTAPPEARRRYAEGYSVAALRDRAVRRAAWDRHHDRWEGLLVTFRSLATGQALLGLPALDGLFAHSSLPNLEGARLGNRDLMEAIWRLAWLADGDSIVPVNWRDMETEELGSVYEGLLELTPRLVDDGRGFAFAEGGEGRGHARKTSGSYYTPDSLVQTLLNSALDPVLDRVEAEADDPAKALLDVTVIDPACGSGHFLLSAARRIATRIARARSGGVASADDYRHALRDVARRCIFGVDRNPMAVELAKVALWIETVEPGKPLGFLDASIRCGDSLLGIFDLAALTAGIPDDAYKPLTGDDKATAKWFASRNKAEKKGQGTLDFERGSGALPPDRAASAMEALRALPEDTVEEIAEKRRRFAAATGDTRSYATRVAADLYVAAFLLPKTGSPPENPATATIPTTGPVRARLAGHGIFGPLEAGAVDAARGARAFHWPIEFPEIMLLRGGFDVVLGNPPWERIKLQEQEFFASRSPEIAGAPNAAARSAMIQRLAEAAVGSHDHVLYDEFETSRRLAEASSVFARVSERDLGRFSLTGRGDVNTYALFAELFLRLVSPQGRAGAIVPTGIATDATTAPFFGHLVTERRLAKLIDFENREGLFADVHSGMKFCLLTIASEMANPVFAFFLTAPDQLEEERRRFTISAADIARINPNTRTAPVFRSKADAELTTKIYDRVPVLNDETRGSEGNPWGVDFMAMFHMSNDSGLFQTAAQLTAGGWRRVGTDWVYPDSAGQMGLGPGGDGRDEALVPSTGANSRRTRYVPLYEAKMLDFFNHRSGSYELRGDARGYRVLPEVDAVKLSDPNYEVEPFYWVPDNEVSVRLDAHNWHRDWLAGWKDITAVTNERTLIPVVFPRSGVGNKVPLVLTGSETPGNKIAVLIGSLSSLVVDYCVRQKVGGITLNYFIVRQFPVLPPSWYTVADLAFLSPRLLELSYTSHAMAPFARDLGHDGPPFAWNEDRRALLRAELDAFYARAYGLDRSDLRYILDPADAMGADYPSETFRVLKKNEIAKYGEYRTARLVLDAWDRMERGELR